MRGPLRNLGAGWLLAAPAAIFLVVFFAYPVIEIFRLSFQDDSGNTALTNYQDFFATPVYVKILVRTIVTSTAVTLLCAAIAYPYAYLMTIVSSRTRMLMLAAVLIPLWTSLLARTYAWIILLSDVGPVSAFLRAFGVNVGLLGHTAGVYVGMVQVLLPFMTLPLYNTMRTVDRRLLAAAASSGATPAAAFRQVFLPLTRPGIVTGSVMVFILGLGFYVTPALLGSPSQSMLAQLTAQEISLKLAWGSAGAMSLVLSVLTLLIIGIAFRLGAASMLRQGGVGDVG